MGIRIRNMRGTENLHSKGSGAVSGTKLHCGGRTILLGWQNGWQVKGPPAGVSVHFTGY